MVKKIGDLEPKIVWQIFDKITTIPRCSKKEEKIQSWLKGWADENNVPFKQDQVGNILLVRDPAPGCEGYPTITLQGHMDMVCEKDSSSSHNFDTDPIPTKIQGDVVTAVGTTLGADNGIGMALSMALLIDPSIKKHGRIETLLTVDEETGLTGARMLQKDFFAGKRLINMDSEELGVIIIGSAGGGGTQYQVPITLEETKGWKTFKLEVDGLLGGHSGVDIHLPRLNANKLLGEGLKAVIGAVPLRISHIEGGTRGNAIPRSAYCEFQVPEKHVKKAREALTTWDKGLDRSVEKELKTSVTEVPQRKSFSEASSKSVVGIITEVPQGPFSWSEEIEGLVQTSNNMGIVRTEGGNVRIEVSSRTSDKDDFSKNQSILKAIGEKYGVNATQREGGTGWKPNRGSPFLKLVERCYDEVLKSKSTVTAIHAGLECGVLIGLNPEIQAVSIGASIMHPHSPNEQVNIASVGIVWNVLKSIAQNVDKE